MSEATKKPESVAAESHIRNRKGRGREI